MGRGGILYRPDPEPGEGFEFELGEVGCVKGGLLMPNANEKRKGGKADARL
jgi:hypothetical protein